LWRSPSKECPSSGIGKEVDNCTTIVVEVVLVVVVLVVVVVVVIAAALSGIKCEKFTNVNSQAVSQYLSNVLPK